MIIAIDGPAGAGKSTIAQRVAHCLGLTYLDTGAMYRAVTLLALERSISLENQEALGRLATELSFSFVATAGGSPRVLAGGRDVTDSIRSTAVSQKVSQVAAHHSVRHALTVQQRQMAEAGDMVLEGRDIGTVVCPGAELKVYLTASVEERARRRQQQLEAQGVEISLKALERDLLLRDQHDAGRLVAPLLKAKDAVELDTTHLTIDEVVDAICVQAERAGLTTRPRDGNSAC